MYLHPGAMRCALVVITALSLSACFSSSFTRDSSKGTTKGKIFVSSPKVVIRETLFNDRTREVGWLSAALDNSDSESVVDIQGFAESNRSATLEAGLRAQIGPQIGVVTSGLKTQIEGNEYLRDENRLDHEIRMARKRAELAKLSQPVSDDDNSDDVKANAGSASDPATNTAGSSTSTSEGAAANGQAINQSLQTLKEMRELLGSSGNITGSKASTSSIDRFRARLAFREEIRAELQDHLLDDRHDLKGSTLYRLKFDTTIFPGADTSDWAVVDVALVEPNIKGTELLGKLADALGKRIRYDAENLRDLAVMHGLAELPGHFQERMLATAQTLFPVAYRDGAHACQLEGEATVKLHCDLAQELDLLVTTAAGGKNALPRERRRKLDQWISTTLQRMYSDDMGLSNYMTIQVDSAYPYKVEVKPIAGKEGAFWDHVKCGNRNVYAYAATPKEVVQRISQVASDRDAKSFLLDIGFLGGQVGGNAGLRRTLQAEQLMQALLQQPLVVGYSEQPETSACSSPLARFGWIQGPRYEVKTDKSGNAQWRFRHRVVQNSLSASVVVPAWWDTIRLKVCPQWQAGGDGMVTENGCGGSPRTMDVPVKANYLALLDLLSDRLAPVPIWTWPSSGDQEKSLLVGESADILIHGWNLWRNAQVTVGSQRADAVYVMPDGTGIIAHLKKVADFPGEDGEEFIQGVTVWTSHGHSNAQAVKVRRPKQKKDEAGASQGTLSAALGPQIVVTDNKKYSMEITGGSLPGDIKKTRVEVRTGEADWTEVLHAGTQVGPTADCAKGRVCFLLTRQDEKSNAWSPLMPLASRVVIEENNGKVSKLASATLPLYVAAPVGKTLITTEASKVAGETTLWTVKVTFDKDFAKVKPALDLSKLRLVATNDAWAGAAKCLDPADAPEQSKDSEASKPVVCESQIRLKLKGGVAPTTLEFKVVGPKQEDLGLDPQTVAIQ